MNRVLVTGGAGYIGSHVVKELSANQIHVDVVDNLSTGNVEALSVSNFYQLDISNKTDMSILLQEGKYDCVLHFAASISVDESIENPTKYMRNNYENTKNLLDLCIKSNIKNFIFSSTAAVYGDVSADTVSEQTACKPISPYGESKLLAENYIKEKHDSINHMIFRYFNVCGADPDGQIGQAYAGAKHLFYVCCEAALGRRDKVYVFGDQYETPDGTCIRDYIHVSDLASAHISGLNFLLNGGKSNLYNCGYSHGYSVFEIIEAVKRVSGVDFQVIVDQPRNGDISSIVAKSDKIRRDLNWQPRYDNLDVMVKSTLDWMGSQRYQKWMMSKNDG